jgi:phage host-nuclease inhibitor protein Gam
MTYPSNAFEELPEALLDSYEEAEARAFANRLLAQLRDVRGELQANDAEYTRVWNELTTRHELRQRALYQREKRILQLLEQLAAFIPTRGKKSVALLGGTIGWRTKPARWHVTDEDALLDWARQHAPDIVAVRTTYSVPHDALVRYLGKPDEEPPSGQQIPPGVELVPKSEQFYAVVDVDDV